MKIYKNPSLDKRHCNGVIAIGNFDGLHLGHQKVISEAKLKAKKNKNGYPEADKVMKNGILLACHHGLTSKMIKHIHKSIDEFITKYS